MRVFVTLIVLIATLWAVDSLAYGGRLSRAVWSEANYRGKMFRYEVAYWLRSLNR
jgi:hypothetical protein